jgi:uncharacterized phage protein (TIGR01671 family)
MRTIKFRAWDLKKKKMSRVFDLDNASYEGFPPPFTDENGECDTKAKYEVMQFTGLLDKNGKEIYEGDIVACRTDQQYQRYPSEVVIDPFLGNGTRLGTGEWNGTLSTWVNHACEVIGNIYENPDLLPRD